MKLDVDRVMKLDVDLRTLFKGTCSIPGHVC